MPSTNSRTGLSKYWLFTINNPQYEPESFKEKLAKDDGIKAVIFQKEKGEQGTEHYQGYVELAKRNRLSFLRSRLSDVAHYERRRGTAQQAIDYCSKEDTRVSGPYDFGEFTLDEPGQRNDLIATRATLEKGGLTAVAQEHYAEFVRYHRGLEAAFNRLTSRDREPVTVDLFIGNPGVGKSRLAWEMDPQLHSQPAESAWFDGYECHKTLLLEDFAGASSHKTLSATLRLLDRYPLRLAIKGGFTWLKATRIILTTNIHPRQWYQWDHRENQYAALARRIHNVHVWERDGTHVILSPERRDEFFSVSTSGPLPGISFGEYVI